MDTLDTGRLHLRPWTPDDADFVLELYSRPLVQRYLGRTPSLMRDRAEALARIRRWNELRSPHGIWAIERSDAGRLVGTLLLKPIPASGTGEPSGETEIGWHLHPDAWGHGYATEAARCVLEVALDGGLDSTPNGGLDRVVAVTNPANTASQAVARRIGMAYLGRTSAYYDVECELFEARAPLPATRPTTSRVAST